MKLSSQRVVHQLCVSACYKSWEPVHWDQQLRKNNTYTQYGPIKNGRIKNQGSDFEKNKEPALRILDLKNRFTF